MTVLLAGLEKSEYWSSVDDASGNIAASARLQPGEVLHGVNQTVIHDQNQNQYLNAINGIGAAGLPLPEAGTWLEADIIWVWEGQNVMVRQAHSRTLDDPPTVPALFSIYREASDNMLWIKGENVLTGDERIHETINYECITGHQTEFAPPLVPALWKLGDTDDEWPAWVQPTGAHDAYQVDDKVSHVDKHWISTAANNTWEPGVYGWDEVI